MKKILLILLIVGMAEAAATLKSYRGGGADSVYFETDANWMEGSDPAAGDSAVFDSLNRGTVKNCSLTTITPVMKSLQTTSAFTGGFVVKSAGGGLRTTSSQIFDHTGVLYINNLDSVYSGTFHIGSGVGVTSVATCTLVMNGAKDTLDTDKALSFKRLVGALHAGDTLSITSGSGPSFQEMAAGSGGVIFNGAVFTMNPPQARTRIFNELNGAPFIGNSNIFVTPNHTASMTCSLYTPIYYGTGAIEYRKSNNFLQDMYVMNNISVPNGTFRVVGNSGTNLFIFRFNGYTISAKTITFGTTNGSISVSVFCGNSTVNCSTYTGTSYSAGIDSINLQTSTWNIYKNQLNWNTSSGANILTLNAGSSTVNFLSAGACSLTSNGATMYDIVHNGAGIMKIIDTARANQWTETDGGFNQNSKPIILSDDFLMNGTGNVTLDQWLKFTGKNVIAQITTSGTVASAACSLSCIDSCMQLQIGNGKNRNIGRLVLGDSTMVIIAAADTVTVGKNVAGDWSGSATQRTIFKSSTSSPTHFGAPAGVTVTYTDWTNVHVIGNRITATDVSNYNRGGNEGIDFSYVLDTLSADSIRDSTCLSLDSLKIVLSFGRDSISGTYDTTHDYDTVVIDTIIIPPEKDTVVDPQGDSIRVTISVCVGADTTARDTFYVHSNKINNVSNFRTKFMAFSRRVNKALKSAFQ